MTLKMSFLEMSVKQNQIISYIYNNSEIVDNWKLWKGNQEYCTLPKSHLFYLLLFTKWTVNLYCCLLLILICYFILQEKLLVNYSN